MSKLPEGWINVLLSDVAHWGSGGTPARANSAYYGGDIPWVKTGELGQGLIKDTEENLTDLGLQNSSAKMFPKGSVLIAMYGATIGKTAILGIDAATNQACAVGIPREGITTTEYLFHYLSSQKDAFIEAGKGAAQPNISQKVLKDWTIPLASFDEQKRITDKLNSLIVRVKACRERLERIPRILERFRQAVLTTALSGQFTKDWQLNQVEQSELNSSNVSGQLADFADVIDPNPSHRYPSYVGGTIPLLATEQMSGLNNWDISSAKLTTLDFYEARKLAHDFLDDDIIFARKGRIGLARNPPPNSRYVFSHTVFIIRSKTDKILPSYLLWFLRQEWCIDWLLLEMNSNAGVPTLGKSVIERLPITIPDYTEQQEIVRCIEKLYAYAEHVEARYQNALARVEQLTPTLLSKAFRGELVPQDPNEEPASVLLDRIHAERVAQPDKPKRVVTRSKSTMNKISNQSVKEIIHQLPKNTFLFDDLYGEISKKLTGDYDLLKDILFALLDETEPSIMQTFDRETKTMRFIRRH